MQEVYVIVYKVSKFTNNTLHFDEKSKISSTANDMLLNFSKTELIQL